MELFLVTILSALVVAVVIENGSCSLDHPVLEYAATRQRRASSSSSSSSRISSLIRKRAAATTGLAGSERGRNHFDPEKDGFLNDYGFKKGQYEFGQKENLGFTDIRNNVPGEPGIDYAAYLKVPRTRFSCIGRTQGYYADEETGCQVFHVCGGVVEGVDNDQISSFLCPVGSLFSQHLLTCDWWSKVDCGSSSSNTQDYVGKNEKLVDWIKMNFVGATDLVMMKRTGQQQPEKATFRRRQQENDMEINGQQISLPKKLEHSHFTEAAFQKGDERASSLNTARTIINQLNEQSLQQGSLTANTTVKVDERLVESNQHSTEEKKSKFTSTPSLNKTDNDAKVTERDADIDGSSFTEKTNIDQPQHATRRTLDETTKETAIAVADEIKYLSESDISKAENVVVNSAETSGSGSSKNAVSASVINNQSPRDNATVVEYLHEGNSTHITSAAKDKNGSVVTHGNGGSSIDSRHQTAPATVVNVNRYKTQNVHNISGFKINRPIDIAATVAAAKAEKFHSNLNSNTIYQQRQPAMQLQLARSPQTHRQSMGVLQREKIESNLENYSNEQNHGSTNVADVNWQGNIGQAGIQEHSINNAIERTKPLEQQELKQYQLASSLRWTPYGRRRPSHDMTFTVNYHTHYYPEIYQRSAAGADHFDTNNNNKHKTNLNEETNYAVPFDKSQSSNTYQHYDDALSEVEQKQASDDLNFGGHIHAAAAAVVDNDNYHYQRYSKIVNNPEISRNAYNINSELQKESRGLSVVGYVKTTTAATPDKDNLPRPFTAAKNDVNYLHAMDSYMSENDAYSFSVSEDAFEHASMTAAAKAADDERTIIIVNSSSISTGADDEKLPINDSYKSEYIERVSAKEEDQLNKGEVIIQTEFIASLGFDPSNDEEKQ